MLFIGNDIAEVRRVCKLIEKKGDAFLNHIFTKNEIEFCSTKQHPEIHYTGRFSAKEAVKKALLSAKLVRSIPLKQIEITREIDESPQVNIFAKFEVDITIKVSISHTDKYATAVAILEVK
ncbi:MAG: holo-ACP synthase [Candidatus Marinimicrobia bacterium]|nr:holo-ACP synthase [Candidatus Neomarinimicrobiota bacterium]MBL7023211.1 holo-ACP synthase [Candidatus Neomarinimicrobiota bacterium]MBL7109984.1 holo-ACP synthase [Candidatus Neomarinimicrobiota bacterium]